MELHCEEITCKLLRAVRLVTSLFSKFKSFRAGNQGRNVYLVTFFSKPTILGQIMENTTIVIYYHPQRSCGKVIFSQVCVKNSVRGGVCLSVCWDTPPGQTPPYADTPMQTPPEQTHPWADTPLWADLPMAILLEYFLVYFKYHNEPRDG